MGLLSLGALVASWYLVAQPQNGGASVNSSSPQKSTLGGWVGFAEDMAFLKLLETCRRLVGRDAIFLNVKVGTLGSGSVRSMYAATDAATGDQFVGIPRSLIIVSAEDIFPDVWAARVDKAPRGEFPAGNGPVDALLRLGIGALGATRGFLSGRRVELMRAWIDAHSTATPKLSYPYFDDDHRAFFDSAWHLAALNRPPQGTRGWPYFSVLVEGMGINWGASLRGRSPKDRKWLDLAKAIFSLVNSRAFGHKVVPPGGGPSYLSSTVQVTTKELECLCACLCACLYARLCTCLYAATD